MMETQMTSVLKEAKQSKKPNMNRISMYPGPVQITEWPKGVISMWGQEEKLYQLGCIMELQHTKSTHLNSCKLIKDTISLTMHNQYNWCIIICYWLDWPPFLFVLCSFKRWPIKPIANYDASVIWLKRLQLCPYLACS